MEHTTRELARKLRELYPELDRYKVKLDIEFKGDKDYWVVKLERGDHKLHTHLNPKDADDCLNGIKCIYLGLQIGQFLDSFDRLEKKDA